MRIKKTLLVGLITVLLLTAANFGRVYAQSAEEEENISTPAEQIEPEAIPTETKRTYDEGITVKQIDIVGNMLVTDDKILGKMKTKQGSTFDRGALQEDLKSIYDMGYFTDKIKVVPEASPTGVKLRIEVEENIPITGVNFTGNTVISTAELEDLFKDQTGLPQNISQLNEAVAKIEKIYADKGFVLARVKKISDDPDGMVNIEINEGIIDKIKLVGNSKTKDHIIKRNMQSLEGSIYNEDLLKDDLKRVYGTQSFEDVRRVISASTKDPDKYDVTIEVDEKRTGSISLGGGVDTGSGIFGSIGYTNSNFLGRGQNISAVVMAGSGVIHRQSDTVRRASLQFEGSYGIPRIGNTYNSLQTTVFGREYASYQIPLGIERRFGGEVTWARPIKRFRNVAGSIGLEVENIDLREGNFFGWLGYYAAAFPDNTLQQAINTRAQELEGGTFMTIGPSLAYDTRNNALSPTKGWYHTIKVKESFGFGDINQFGRVYGSFRRYIPLGQKTTFALNFQAGSKMFGSIPEFSMFRLGGTNTIRGFREGSIGTGGQYLMGTAEIRAPVPFLAKIKKIPFVDNLKCAFFVDAGRIFNGSISNQIYGRPAYGLSTGFGVRINIPGMGPVRIDYGIPLTKLGLYYGEGGRFNFGFGEKF